MSKELGKFWHWMEEKKYGHYNHARKCHVIDCNDKYDMNQAEPTEQMLEGYMKEYLGEDSEYEELKERIETSGKRSNVREERSHDNAG